MISFGVSITSSADVLNKVKVEYLYHSLRNPKQEIVSKINHLRIIREIDSKQYSLLKRKLPYVVCGMFNPAYRRTENFAYTEYFIIDIDHVYEKGLDIENIRSTIQSDNRVVLCFLSPGEDGLKVMFRLKDRCYDSGIYSLFYKAFLKTFSIKYGLEQVIDERTSDVCRACFISIDSNAYYNPNAQPIEINEFIQNDNAVALFDLKASFVKEIKELDVKYEKVEKCVDPDNDVMLRVKALLNPKKETKIKQEPYIPERLNDIIDDIKHYVESTGIIVYDIINIQYGKKLRFKMNQKLAEINLFYGKHGFSVVQSPRCGTSKEFNELMVQLINSYIYTIT